MIRAAIFNDTSGDHGHYGCRVVMHNLQRHLQMRDVEIVFSMPFDRDWRKDLTSLPEPGSIDLIIVNGEGSMHSSSTKWRAGALSEVAKLARDHYNVPSFVVNATFHNNDQLFYEHLAEFSGVFVRDSASSHQAQAHDVANHVVPDLSMAFGLFSCHRSRSGIGVTDSVVAADNAALRGFSKSKSYDFCPMVEAQSHEISLNRIFRPKVVKQWLKSKITPTDRRFADANDFIKWLSSKELIITGRYHTVTLCILTKTPFMCFESNTPKISALLKDVGLNNPSRIFSRLPTDTSDLSTQWSFKAEELKRIESFLDRAATSNSKMFDLIVESVRV